jgi:hypothetical protein
MPRPANTPLSAIVRRGPKRSRSMPTDWKMTKSVKSSATCSCDQ